MSKNKYPGVYIEELGGLPPSVAQVETAIPVFIGYTQKAENGEVTLDSPTRIRSLLEYEQLFGAAFQETLNIEVDTRQINHNISILNKEQLGLYKMYNSLKMYFANGGDTCYIISVGDYSLKTIHYKSLNQGLERSKKIDAISLIIFPDATGLKSHLDFYKLYQDALKICLRLRDRFFIMDTFSDRPYLLDDITHNPITAFRDNIVLDIDYLKYGAAYFPFLETNLHYQFNNKEILIEIIRAIGKKETTTLNKIQVADVVLFKKIKNIISNLTVLLPPSAAIAGVYCSVDKARGVWKAPANVSINNVIRPSVAITDPEQETLNVDAIGGKSINAIRAFTGRGNLVWGARTLAGNDNEWRYISVRRFFNMVEESVSNALKQFVFEPNNANTWSAVKTMMDNFLITLWRDGALSGSKPENAFFVKVGLGETMTAQDLLDKKMIIEIGMAVVRPSEFIILRLTQTMKD